MLRCCLVLLGTFAIGLGFASDSRASTIRILDLPVRENGFNPTRQTFLLGLANRGSEVRDDDWRRASLNDDDDDGKGRDSKSRLRSRDDDDDDGKGRDNKRGLQSRDDDDDGKARHDDPWKSERDGDDDGKPRHDDDDGWKPKPHDDDDGKPRHDDDDGWKPKPDNDDEGGYSKPIPEPRAILAFVVGGLVVGWATRRARR